MVVPDHQSNLSTMLRAFSELVQRPSHSFHYNDAPQSEDRQLSVRLADMSGSYTRMLPSVNLIALLSSTIGSCTALAFSPFVVVEKVR